MKRKMLLTLIALLAIGLMFVGCPTDETGETPEPPDYGTNLVTEAAILAATGTGVNSVEKVEGGYKITGTVTAYSNWDGSVSDSRIALNIQAHSTDAEAYFAGANRYGITINFPNSTVKPINEYTDGFRIYLENTKTTANTAAWAGTWQHEYAEEYNAIGGVGTMTINRDLTEPAESNEVGDYQHLVIVLIFEDEDVDKTYTFTISDVAVYGNAVESDAGRPEIHGDSALVDATYAQGASATPLNVVATWTDDSSSYTYQWYSNTANSNTGGTIISDETTASFNPPTTAVGVVYYYCVVTNPAVQKSATTRAVKITVTEGGVTPPSLEVTRVHIYLQETVNWGGTWVSQYDDESFSNPDEITFTSGTLTGADIDVWDQFVFDVHYPSSAIGESYEFTFSGIVMNNQAGTNTLTEAEILAGVRGGNAGNGYASQNNVVTKVSDGLYKATMTIITDYHWQDGELDAGITRLIITRASAESVYSYGINATLP